MRAVVVPDVLIGVVSVAVLLAGTTAVVTRSEQVRPAPARSAAVAPPPAGAAPPVTPDAAPGPAAAGTPRALLGLPTGLHPADPVAGTGSLALADLVRLDGGDPTAARDRFANLGFLRARSRAWTGPDDRLLVVTYEFSDARGAETFTHLAAAGRRADPSGAVAAVPGVPGSQVFQILDANPPTQVAFLTRGARAYVVGLAGPAAGPGSGLLRGLLTDGVPSPAEPDRT